MVVGPSQDTWSRSTPTLDPFRSGRLVSAGSVPLDGRGDPASDCQITRSSIRGCGRSGQPATPLHPPKPPDVEFQPSRDGIAGREDGRPLVCCGSGCSVSLRFVGTGISSSVSGAGLATTVSASYRRTSLSSTTHHNSKSWPPATPASPMAAPPLWPSVWSSGCQWWSTRPGTSTRTATVPGRFPRPRRRRRYLSGRPYRDREQHLAPTHRSFVPSAHNADAAVGHAGADRAVRLIEASLEPEAHPSRSESTKE